MKQAPVDTLQKTILLPSWVKRKILVMNIPIVHIFIPQKFKECAVDTGVKHGVWSLHFGKHNTDINGLTCIL